MKAYPLAVHLNGVAVDHRGRAVNVQEAGRDLGVRYMLEGSVRAVSQSLAAAPWHLGQWRLR